MSTKYITIHLRKLQMQGFSQRHPNLNAGPLHEVLQPTESGIVSLKKNNLKTAVETITS